MNTSPENNPPLLESDAKTTEKIMEVIITYVDEQGLTAQEIQEAFSMLMTDDSSEEGVRLEILKLRDLMMGVKTNQSLSDSVRSYILAAYSTEGLGTTFN